MYGKQQRSNFMNLTKKILLSTAGVVAVSGAGLWATSAMAAGGKNDLASAIADKFHLSRQEVQATISQFQQEKQTDRTTEFNARLDQAVKDGTLTADQKTKILAERQLIMTRNQDIKKMTDPAARQQAKKQLLADIAQWVKDNNIPRKWLGMK